MPGQSFVLCKRSRVAFRSFSTLFHHFIRYIIGIAERGSSAKSTIGTAFAALSAGSINIVRTRTIAGMTCD